MSVDYNNSEDKKIKRIAKESIKINKLKKGIDVHIDESNMEILCDDGEIIKTIYHLADVHISKFEERHGEYRLIFKRLVDEIKKDTNNAMIYVGGDIVHEKNALSPAQIMLVKEFFIMLSDLLPVVVIIGNHDVSPHGNTIDSISPILTNSNTKNNIYLLLDDKLYKYNNIVFGVTTLGASTPTPTSTSTSCVNNNVNNNMTKIGLYHGFIHGATLDNGFDMSNSGKFNVSDFKEHYDIVMLGDIHKHQYLDAKKTMAYSGALLQFGFGESLNCGMIKWDVITKKSRFIQIKNDYGFVKLKADSNGLHLADVADVVDQLNNLKYPTIQLEYENISSFDAEKHLEEIRAKYPNSKCLLRSKIGTDNINIMIGKGKDKIKIIDIDNDDIVVKHISKFMKESGEYDKEEIKLTIDKIYEILKELDHNYYNQVKQFRLKSLKFDNFFNFGKDNVMDYTNMKGIIGLSGNSFIGKSTLGCDLLLYAIFGECLRGDKQNIINVNINDTQKKMYTDVTFEINEDVYRIVRERLVSDKNKRSTVKISFYKNKKNISKEDADETDAYIKKVICSYENFIDITMMLQNVFTGFIDLKDNDKKQLMFDLLKLNVFNDILNVARSMSAGLVRDLSMMRKKREEDDNNNHKRGRKKESFDKNKKLKILEKEINELHEKSDEAENEYNNISEKCEVNKRYLIEYDFKRKEFDGLKLSIDEIGELSKKIKECKALIAECEAENNIYRDDMDKITNEKVICTNKLNELNESLKKYKNMEKKNEKFKNDKNDKLNNLDKEIEVLLSSKTKQNNKFINSDSKKVKSIHDKEIKINNELKSKIEDYENNINDLFQKIIKNKKPANLDKNYGVLQDLRNEKEDNERKCEDYKNNLIKVKTKLKSLQDHEYDPDCEYCMKYPVTMEKIKCNDEIKHIETELKCLTILIDKLNDKIDKYIKYEKMYDDYVKQEEMNNLCTHKIDEINDSLTLSKKDIEISTNKIREYDDYFMIIEENKKIDDEYLRLRNERIILLHEGNNEYDEYDNMIYEKKNCEKKIDDYNNQIDKLNMRMEKNNNTIYINRCENEKTEVRQTKINSYKKELIDYNKKKSEIEKDDKLYKTCLKEHKSISDELSRIEREIEDERKFVKEYTEKEEERKVLEMIVSVIGKDKGFIDTVMTKNVIPKFESDINDLLEQIASYKVNILYTNGRFNICKTKNGKKINIGTLSGCERFIANLCFKLVLDKYNNSIKPGFIVLDEVFTCCDDENIERVKLVFDYIKKQYDYAIVISHDARIKKLYDEDIELTRKNGNSHICYKK